MKYSFSASAHRQILDVIAFYAQEHRSLSDDFIKSLDESITLLIEHPRIGQRVSMTHRKISLRKFPYILIYAVEDENDQIQISAVCHQRRRPGYWRSCVEEPKVRYAIDQRAA